MATSSFSEEDLICPRCTEIYRLPALLQCGHNVCKPCLQAFWEWKGCRECPVCHTVVVSRKPPPINLALKIAADEYQVRMARKSQDLCVLHNEKLKIFCQNDEEPICLICQMSKQHKTHDCSPVEEAAQQKKTEISAKLESIRKRLRDLRKTKENWEETRSYIQTQADQNQNAIKEEFEKLHFFLLEEEKTRLKALKQEEEVKMQDYKQTTIRVKTNIGGSQCIRDILIDSAKHLGSLKFGIWKKMANIVQYAPVTMDPNTAQSNLKFSEELTCVQYASQPLLPNNPERCSGRVCVLGATGFTSGKHSWTVDVSQSKDWYIGVASESYNRKSAAFLCPSDGFWVIGQCDGDSFQGQRSSQTTLVFKERPQRIVVELDYDKGKVVFTNAVDFKSIYTFKEKFRERLFPYFSPGMCGEGKQSNQLRICPLTITMNVEKS
ncbi:zinc-binding protein A33-like isoform 2-T2 [Aulostomus maculatus]